MKISLLLPAALHEIGGRSSNQDAIFPPISQATPDDRLFVVCDGVGGANHGEVASHLLTELIPFYVAQSPPGDRDVHEWLDELLVKLETDFTKYFIEECPECEGMSTTLCLLYLNEQGAIVGWVGDSRIYHFRGGDIPHITKDHSLVQQLVDEGVIDAAEARVHPRRNVILRAVMGAGRPTRIDGGLIEDLRPGDYFFICTDGMLENWPDEKLQKLFATGQEPEALMAEIFRQSVGNTHDNFSGYIIQIAEVE